MTFRSTRSVGSSLVGPPTTVREDEHSIPGIATMQDENRPNWNSHSNGSVSRNTELDLSPPAQKAIQEFNDELDTLLNSFDGFFAQKKRSVAPPPLPRSTQSIPSRQREPLPSSERISPMKASMHSTPARKPQRFDTETSSEDPPPPVQTPGLRFPTPNRQRRRMPSTPKEVDSLTPPRMEPRPTHILNEHHEGNIVAKVEDLYCTAQEQQRRIQELEIENECLRKKLEIQPPKIERMYRASPMSQYDDRSLPRFDAVVEVRRERTDISTIREEPEGRRQQSNQSYPSTPTGSRRAERPPRHIQTAHVPTTVFEEEEEERLPLTPGTRFVAELASLMKLDNSQRAPLSEVIDKHWDHLKHFLES